MTVQEALGESPNGSGFVITLGAAPGLDATNLVVGRVVGGMDLVRDVALDICLFFRACSCTLGLALQQRLRMPSGDCVRAA